MHRSGRKSQTKPKEFCGEPKTIETICLIPQLAPWPQVSNEKCCMSFGSHNSAAQAAAHAEIVPVHNQGWEPKERLWNSHVMVHFVPKSSWQGQRWNSTILEVFSNLNDAVNRLFLPLSQPGQPKSKDPAANGTISPKAPQSCPYRFRMGRLLLMLLVSWKTTVCPKWDFSPTFHSLILIW